MPARRVTFVPEMPRPFGLSAIVPEIDARFEQVILQCLAGDPKRRPDSAYAVAAALPGGDPLAMALAAGETPSPSMVAAASPSGALSPRVAMGCLAVALLALFFVVRLADRTFFLPQAGLVKSPAVLADKAEQIIAMLRHAPSGQEHWQGFAIDRGYLQYAAAAEDRHRTWEDLPSGRPPAVCFWYRAGGDQTCVAGPAWANRRRARVSDRSRHGYGAAGWPGKAAAIRRDARSQRCFRRAFRPGGLVGAV